jgi:hypothetical protein
MSQLLATVANGCQWLPMVANGCQWLKAHHHSIEFLLKAA